MASPTSGNRMSILKDHVLGGIFCFIGGLLPAMVPKAKDLTGKTAIVTGSNSGVGYGFALQLAEMGATVYLACRNEKRAVQSQADMLKECPDADIKTLSLDTSSFDSVKTFTRNWNHGPIDILAHNAGVSQGPKGQDFTQNGYEYQYQVNFLSSFLLTHLLEDQLAKDARVIFTSSIGSYFGQLSTKFAVAKTQNKIESGFHTGVFDSGNSIRYAQTKLMQAAFAKALQSHFDRQPNNERLAFSFEPGLVQSNLLQNSREGPFDPAMWVLGRLQPLVGLDVRRGSATGIHVATSDEPEVFQNRGRYFDRMRPRSHPADTLFPEQLDRLWTRWSADCDISWSE